MKFLKVAGTLWGVIYFAVGAAKSFTLNANDELASVALLFALFLLPLPISISAFWVPRVAGKALSGCIAINAATVAAHAFTSRASFSDVGRFVVVIALYNLPHLLFGVIYLKAAQASDDQIEDIPAP